MKTLFNLSRYILGIVFVVSGFVKAIDPAGTAYKFDDYFVAFHIGWLQPASMFFSILQSSAEFLIGCSLLFNLFTVTGIWLSFIFMLFFTILTFFLAIFNPVTDCGCFGDAIVLSNWQTFYKNVFFMLPAIFLFKQKKLADGSVFQSTLAEFAVFAILILAISFYAIKYEPLIDFRPYKTGVNIAASMKIPDDAPRDVYQTTVIYSKDGFTKEFELNNLPDSTWQWIETKNKLIKKGYEPPIHDFSIISTIGEDITDLVLEYKEYTFIFISPKLEKIKDKNINRIAFLANLAYANGHRFIGLTASNLDEINKFNSTYQLPFQFYNTDETTLKTIVRSNPGIMLIHNGTIIAKWAGSDIPNPLRLMENIESYILTNNYSQVKNFIIILFSFFVIFIHSIFKMIK